MTRQNQTVPARNAGRQQSDASILDISTGQFDWTMKTNIDAPFWLIKAGQPDRSTGLPVAPANPENRRATGTSFEPTS
jgi:NAD(P)-dependent dehydrogenase (short-subunit alcohol dehydrogenase family)